MGDLGTWAISDELAIHEPQRPGAHLLNDLCGVVDDEDRPGTAPRMCVLLSALVPGAGGSPVDRASSMRRMSGFAAAAIANRRREDIPEE